VVPPKEEPKATKKKAPAAAPPKSKKGPEVKERLTVHLTVDVIERAKNAVYWSPGLTLAGLAEKALHKALEGLEKTHGGPFAHRKEELKGGRPIK